MTKGMGREPHAMAAVVAAADGDDFGHDVHKERVEGAEAATVADDLVCKLV
jgi:hypothetical protein